MVNQKEYKWWEFESCRKHWFYFIFKRPWDIFTFNLKHKIHYWFFKPSYFGKGVK